MTPWKLKRASKSCPALPLAQESVAWVKGFQWGHLEVSGMSSQALRIEWRRKDDDPSTEGLGLGNSEACTCPAWGARGQLDQYLLYTH